MCCMHSYSQGKATVIEFATNTPVESASNEQLLVLMAYKYLFMSC